jgi:hypothetical protein
MIVFLVTGAHSYTHEALRKTGRFDLRIISYNRVLRTPWLKRATYIFSDLDRLNFWELELAARLYRRLKERDARVLNDPARARQRFGLLKLLKQRGVNSFDVWRVEETSSPERYPVFLRTESAHRGPLSDLLWNQDEVRAAIEDAVEQGFPLRGLLLIEYRAEPVRDGVFRKDAIYRVGDRMVPCLSVHESRWKAKGGEMGIAGQELYDDEYDMVVENRHGNVVRTAFDVSDIDYGRADFGFVDGRPEVYEINTNPMIKRVGEHPFPVRMEAGRLAFEKLIEAFEAIDMPAGPRVRIRDPRLGRQLREDKWMTFPRWTP